VLQARAERAKLSKTGLIRRVFDKAGLQSTADGLPE
jgi:hypothetical protein